MRIIICDDNQEILASLSEFIKSYFKNHGYKLPEIICYTDGTSLLNDNGRKDIVFLDIQLPDVNGIEIGNKLSQNNKDIIIIVITSYIEYLDDAMRFHVFRYLPKPLIESRITRNLSDAIQFFNNLNSKIIVETKDHIYTLNASDIVAIEGHFRKVIVYTLTQSFYSVHTIEYWEKTLPVNSFFRTHRNYIVNLSHVTDFDKYNINVTDNILPVYLTERKYTTFKKIYLRFIENR